MLCAHVDCEGSERDHSVGSPMDGTTPQSEDLICYVSLSYAVYVVVRFHVTCCFFLSMLCCSRSHTAVVQDDTYIYIIYRKF